MELSLEQVQELVAPALGRRRAIAISRAEGGLVNLVLRVEVDDGEALQLRVFTGAEGAFEKELELSRCCSTLPMHDLLLADGSLRSIPRPYTVSRWIEGIRLNELRRQVPPEVVAALARPLGALAVQVAQTTSPASLPRARTAALAEAAEQLRAGPARDRLGATTADRLRGVLEEHAGELAPHRERMELVHGDFGARNLLVAGTETGWRIAGLIDWEMAFRGWGLWDVGSLFRYRRRFGAPFHDGFARGYTEAGGALPGDWFRLARLLDATRSIATLTEELEHLPDVLADCREVLEGVVEDWR